MIGAAGFLQEPNDATTPAAGAAAGQPGPVAPSATGVAEDPDALEACCDRGGRERRNDFGVSGRWHRAVLEVIERDGLASVRRVVRLVAGIDVAEHPTNAHRSLEEAARRAMRTLAARGVVEVGLCHQDGGLPFLLAWAPGASPSEFNPFGIPRSYLHARERGSDVEKRVLQVLRREGGRAPYEWITSALAEGNDTKRRAVLRAVESLRRRGAVQVTESPRRGRGIRRFEFVALPG